jgi:hypothetical protein
MNLSYKILLTISCVSLSLHSMEKLALTTNNNSPTNLNTYNQKKPNFYLVNNLYKTANSTLETYNPNGLQSIIEVSDIIAKSKKLADDNIEKKEIGLFAYKQTESIKNKIFSSNNPPHHGPQYVAVFFAKIEEYNDHLTKNKFTSPTVQQFMQYMAIKSANTFKLFTIASKNKMLCDIPNTVAAREFEELMNDISTMQQVAPDIIKTLADILYGSDKEEEHQNSANKL